MNLAQRLNELAQANSDGLLSDDEYRLLRQSAFEQYSEPLVIPVEKPVGPAVPVVLVRSGSQHKSSSPAKPQPIETTPSKLTTFIRRAAGRNASRERPSTAGARFHDPTPSPTPQDPFTPAKRGLIPRIFHKKPHDLSPLQTNFTPKFITTLAVQSPLSTASTSPPTPNRLKSKLSAFTAARKLAQAPVPNSPVASTGSNGSSNDNPATSKEIRDMVLSTEAELERLVDAFDALEQGVIRRIKKRNARRLPAVTPPNVNVLLEGRDWRGELKHHRMSPSVSTPLFDPRTRSSSFNSPAAIAPSLSMPRYITLEQPPLTSDRLSVHSGHSDRTSFSFSHSRSIPSLPKQTTSPSSPLSPHFRSPPPSSLKRKASLSSVSSRGTSAFSALGGRFGAASATQLPLSPSSQSHVRGGSTDDDSLILLDGLNLTDDDPDQDHLTELNEIRQRKKEVIARYAQRIEYLKAKQKGAELHEKLLRK